jgi:hypothetical protein
MKALFHWTLATLGLAAIPAFAGSLMPDLSLVPTGWGVDRYAPSSFSNLGTVNGQNNVLGIGIGSSGDSANRVYQDTFYNTQGENHSISGGPGGHVDVLLYVPASWSDPTSGDVRTDLWVNTAGDDYGILGFTNFGTNNRAGAPGGTFQYWDAAGNWNVVSAPVNYDQWNLLDIQYSGSEYNYLINGTFVGSSGLLASPNAALTQVLLQAYNYNDPAFGGYYGHPEVTNNRSVAYTAEYANYAPEPASFGLIGLGLLGLSAAARRKSRA